ncbi:hypothetical protein DFQ26_003516 [Actinomortierella ambigua]|nr:hypothetical protein DFQ26_003516 [Actinomortierella ambigua]
MAPSDLHVIIAGAGVAGLSLAVMLEKGGVKYTVVERAKEAKYLGSGLALSVQVMRVFDQIGVLKDLDDVSTRTLGGTWYTQDMKEVASIISSDYKQSFGYDPLMLGRPEFIRTMLRHVPEEKIMWGKKVMTTMQNENGVMLRFSDNTTLDGDILVGCDGAYSAVRQSLYQNLAKKGIKVPESDLAPLRFQEFSVLGITKPLGDSYPELKEKYGLLKVQMGTSASPYKIGLIPIGEGRVAWDISGDHLQQKAQSATETNFRFSDWDSESMDDLRGELDNLPLIIGGTLGDLINNSDSIARVMLEDRWFHTWYEGRTVLVGDACHKMIPSTGQGANQAIVDCVVLANLIHELPSKDVKDLSRAFAKYFEIRGETTKAVIDNSKTLGHVVSAKSGIFAPLLRKMVFKVASTSFFQKKVKLSMAGRPALNYLPRPDPPSTIKDDFPAMTVGPTKSSVAV